MCKILFRRYFILEKKLFCVKIKGGVGVGGRFVFNNLFVLVEEFFL